MIIELLDGGVEEIYTDQTSYGGCPTCDHGSEYISEFQVEMTSGNIEVEINKMYDYALTTGYMLKLFLNNVETIKQMKEYELYTWLKETLEKEYKDVAEEIKVDFISN